MEDNDFAPLGKCGNFCSECKFVLNSIYTIGTALSINECESITDKEPKDYNSLLSERVKSIYENLDIINKNDKKCNNSQSKLPSSTQFDKCRDNAIREDEIQVLSHKQSKKFEKVDKKPNELNRIYVAHDDKKYFTCVKPTIVEDKILPSPEKLNINDWKRQQLQILNYKCDCFKCFTSHKTIQNVDKICKDSTIHCKDLKNVYGIEKQSRELTDISCTITPICSKSQNKENKAHNIVSSDYLSQYSILKSTVLNKHKKVSDVAKNLLTLSTYLNDICKTILKTEDPNPCSAQPNISFNLSKKVDKSTSPILFSKSYSQETDLATSQEHSHDMYRYNPYHSKNILQKKK